MDNKLNIIQTGFEGLLIIEPNSYRDERGAFSRIFCEDELKCIFKDNHIKQINHSVTVEKGTVRGMHFQYPPYAEVKMVKCIKGSVYDVVIDIREKSETFLQSFTIALSSKNQKMIYIPEGFAHGFQTLEDNSELVYFHSNIYTPKNEGALNINDPLLSINFPLDIINLSKRDEIHTFLDENFKGIEI